MVLAMANGLGPVRRAYPGWPPGMHSRLIAFYKCPCSPYTRRFEDAKQSIQ